MATWSSYPQHQLMVEGFRDFLKRKKKSSATYPASELTTIVNLISNLAKKFSIETDTDAIVDEFEAMLKSQNIDLQEQDDRLMIGADLKLDLSNAPKLKSFMASLESKEPQALQLLVKALKKGAFQVGDTTKQPAPRTPVATPVAPTPTPDAGEPSRIDTIRPPRSIRDIKGSEKYKKFMTNLLNFFANEMKMDTKIAKKIVHDIWKQTPPSGNFNKLIFLEAIDKEIDIASILAKSGLPPVQQVKVLGALKKWAAQNSDLVDDRMTKILRLRDKDDDRITKSPRQRNKVPDFDGETGVPITDEGRDKLLDSLSKATTKDQFKEIYNRLLQSEYGIVKGKDADAIKNAIENNDPMRISSFGNTEEEKIIAVRRKFIDLFLSAKTTDSKSSQPSAAEEPDAAAAEEPPSPPAAEEPDAPAVEEPKDFVTSKLKEAGVEEGKIKAFLNDLRKMGVISEISQNAFKKAFKLNDSEFKKLLEDHPEVTKVILAMRPKRGGTEFLEAIAKIVVKEKPTRAKRTVKKATPKAKPTRAKTTVKKATPKAKPTSNKKTKAAAKEPEPEAAKPEQTPDPNFTRRTVRRIKTNYNKLKIEDRLNFNKLKEAIEKISKVESVKKQQFGKNSLFVITLTNGEQFGLPKELQRDKLEFAFKESEEASNPKASALDKVIKLAKIKDGKIEEKGIVKYGTALKESLILTWKQIAGI